MKTVGFTVLELVFVLLLAAVVLAVAAQSYGVFLRRTAARRAAELFARDLSLTRTAALRDRRPAVLAVSESANSYVIRNSSGEVIVERDFGPGSDIPLTSLDLALPGDSVAFSARGLATLSGGAGSLGLARFVAGAAEYVVRFNGTGASDVQEP